MERETLRVVAYDPPVRSCERCGSFNLGLVLIGHGYARKECLTCGSTGPFAPVPAVSDGAAPGVE